MITNWILERMSRHGIVAVSETAVSIVRTEYPSDHNNLDEPVDTIDKFVFVGTDCISDGVDCLERELARTFAVKWYFFWTWNGKQYRESYRSAWLEIKDGRRMRNSIGVDMRELLR